MDRVKNVSLTGKPREGDDEFTKLDVRTYLSVLSTKTLNLFSESVYAVFIISLDIRRPLTPPPLNDTINTTPTRKEIKP